MEHSTVIWLPISQHDPCGTVLTSVMHNNWSVVPAFNEHASLHLIHMTSLVFHARAPLIVFKVLFWSISLSLRYSVSADALALMSAVHFVSESVACGPNIAVTLRAFRAECYWLCSDWQSKNRSVIRSTISSSLYSPLNRKIEIQKSKDYKGRHVTESVKSPAVLFY